VPAFLSSERRLRKRQRYCYHVGVAVLFRGIRGIQPVLLRPWHTSGSMFERPPPTISQVQTCVAEGQAQLLLPTQPDLCVSAPRMSRRPPQRSQKHAPTYVFAASS
jgi:hypothetical protein